MQLNSSVMDEIMKINWLSNAGKNTVSVSEVKYVQIQDKDKALNHLFSSRWENICLEASNQLTAYLTKNKPDIYSSFWNVGVKEIKQSILPKLAGEIQNKCVHLELPLVVLDYVQMDIVSIIMVLSYREYFYSEFFEKMLVIYKSGFLPCGWIGKFPGGKYEIY